MRLERRLLGSRNLLVAGCDEVGRGALSGPVSVGMVLIDRATRGALPGVRDSKLLSASERERLIPRIRHWSLGGHVGHASAEEVDEWGLTGALRLAGHRALVGLPFIPDVIILDGRHDWLTPPLQESLLPSSKDLLIGFPRVVTLIKADLTCSSVAAASVLAKVTRDAIMVDLATHYPSYGWDSNKGYGSAHHIEEIRQRGPTKHHRRTWLKLSPGS